jgi:uncharacterized small protein (DUF1192 family)
MLTPGPVPTRPTGEDEAFLRLAFREAAEATADWQKNPMLVWRRLYEAVIASDAGLEVVGYIDRLEAQVARLQVDVDRLNATIERPAKLPATVPA